MSDRYEIWCCDGHVATVITKTGPLAPQVKKIEAPPGEMSWATITERRKGDTGPGLAGLLSSRVVEEAADAPHPLERRQVTVGHVLQIRRDGRDQWVIRCLSDGCTQRLQVSVDRLPQLAYVLTSGDWAVTGSRIPLRVLNSAISGHSR